MSGSYILQPQTRAAGDSGHVTDHDNLGAVLAGNGGIVFNVLNTSYSGGADPTGSSDCTAAFQACLDALAASGGGVMYIPQGTYKQNNAVTWTSSNSLAIIGDGPGATTINQNSTSAPMIYWAVSNCGRLAVRDIKFNNTANAPSFSSTNVSFQCTSVAWGAWYNVAWQGGQRVNQCVVLNNCTNIDFGTCDMRSYVNCIVMEGTTATVTVHDGSFGQNSGSGVATAASILMTGDPQTLHVTNTVFNSGDRGLLLTGGTGANPAFVLMYDAELNNMSLAGLDFETGAEVQITACWLASATGTNSMVFGSSFEGSVSVAQTVFQGATGHNVEILGGSGYSFVGCIFGSNAKAFSDAADMMYISGAVSWVTVNGCHFNTDPYYGIGTSYAPRSAVYIASGATSVFVKGCTSLPNGSYGTAALVNNAGSMTESPVNNV